MMARRRAGSLIFKNSLSSLKCSKSSLVSFVRSKHSRPDCIDFTARFRCENYGNDRHHTHANNEKRDRRCVRIGGNQGNGATCNCPEFARASYAGVTQVSWKKLGKECRLAARQSGVDAAAEQGDAKPNCPSVAAIHHPEVGDHEYGCCKGAASIHSTAADPVGQRPKNWNENHLSPCGQAHADQTNVAWVTT